MAYCRVSEDAERLGGKKRCVQYSLYQTMHVYVRKPDYLCMQ